MSVKSLCSLAFARDISSLPRRVANLTLRSHVSKNVLFNSNGKKGKKMNKIIQKNCELKLQINFYYYALSFWRSRPRK
jgi:hypothetical protein